MNNQSSKVSRNEARGEEAVADMQASKTMTFADKSRQKVTNTGFLEDIVENYVKDEEELTLRDKTVANFTIPPKKKASEPEFLSATKPKKISRRRHSSPSSKFRN